MLYVNDLPQVSEFSTTLFADDTYLVLPDKSLVSLETTGNTQLQNIDIWLRRNKLSLNYSKTTYLLCNKHPYQSIKTKFTVVMNEKVLRRSYFVKYEGVYIDEKLTWSVHINKLSLQLAKHSAMLYQIRDYVTEHTLNMLYYSFVYSILNYGIIVWGTATQNQLHEINVRMNNIVRTITWNKLYKSFLFNCIKLYKNNKFSHVTHLYKKLNYLKLNDIYHLELAKLMHKICNNKLPLLFQQRFNKIELVTLSSNKKTY